MPYGWLIAVAFLLLSTGRADAQWLQGAGYIAAGVAATATDELDDMLVASGYPSFGSSAFSISLGAYMTVASRLMLGGEWNGVIKGAQEHEGRAVYLGGGYGTLGAGYAVNVSPRVRVYPRLGLGVGGLGLTFETTEDTISFGDVLEDPERAADQVRGFQPSLTREHAVVDVGTGAEFLPNRTGRGTMIGLRLGYVFSSSSSDWEQNHRPVSGGPAATVGGPYLRITFGAAGWR